MVQPRPALRFRVVAASPPQGEGETPPPPDGVGARKPRGPLSAETKEKQSAAAKKRDHTPAARALLAAAHAGKKKAFAERPRARGSVRSLEVCSPVVVSAATLSNSGRFQDSLAACVPPWLHHSDAAADV